MEAGTQIVRKLSHVLSIKGKSDVWYVLPPIAASLLLYSAYLFGFPYPAYGAGLYAQFASSIIEHGYGLPSFVYGYGPEPIPFAYPPLGLYGLAFLRDVLGVDMLTITRLVPGLLIPFYVVSGYVFAREWVETRSEASIAALAVATIPSIFALRLSAGGVVRTPATVLLFLGLYTATRLFERRDTDRWLVASNGVLFGLLLLTHPIAAAFFGLSCLFLWAALDRSGRGFLSGAAVAVVGTLIASPWLLTVASRHGWSVFMAALGSWGGISPSTLPLVMVFTTPRHLFPSLWLVLLIIGNLLLLVERRWVLPVWVGLSAVFQVFDTQTLMIATPMMGVAMYRIGTATAKASTLPSRVPVRFGVIAILCLYATFSGAAYAMNVAENEHGMIKYIDKYDVETAEWAERHTSAEARFVVIGDAGEWFPYLSGRTSVSTHQGQEWVSWERQSRYLDRQEALASCGDISCVEQIVAAEGWNADYLYIPKDDFTARWRQQTQPTSMRRSIRTSDQYRIVYENEGVMIVTSETDGVIGDNENLLSIQNDGDDRVRFARDRDHLS